MTNIYHFFFLAGGMCWPRPSPPHLHFEFPLLSPALLQIPIHVPRSAYVSNAFDETNSFGVTLLVPSLLCGLLHDVFQYVSAHPIPIEICYGMLSHACLFVT